MKDAIVRVLSVELSNFKNVNKGVITFPEFSDAKKGLFFGRSGVLGIYGQNGSGKTTFIQVMGFLKQLITEKPLEDSLFDDISIWSDSAKAKFILSICHFEEKFLISYEVRVKKDIGTRSVFLERELFSFRRFDNLKQKWGKAIFSFDIDFKNENFGEVFGPNLVSKKMDKKLYIDAYIIKQICLKNRTSFIFNKDMLEMYKTNKSIKSVGALSNMVGALKLFGEFNLLIIENRESSLISSRDLMQLKLRLVNNRESGYWFTTGVISLKLFEPQVVSTSVFEIIESLISEINFVMPTLLPNFSIQAVGLGSELMNNGEKGEKIEFVSVIDGFKIPLKNESEGTKKIISICSALISMYNNETVCLCIDEFDSGVFEFLFGQILKILSQEGKGQVIFTSHNLRPLEVLPYEDIIITTTNKDNRYIKLKNVKSTNNLRDFYLRGVLLGGQNEEIYKETEISDIARSFRKAGEINDGIRN